MPSQGLPPRPAPERQGGGRRQPQQKARNKAKRPLSRRSTGLAVEIGAAPGLVNDAAPIGRGPRKPLLLADRTKERRAPGLDVAGDRAVAPGSRAGRAFAVVDGEGMLE